MVVYVDGKPIFVKNPKINASESNDAQVPRTSHSRLSKNKNQSSANKPVAKIPYLLAAAAAAAASNQGKIESTQTINNQQNSKLLRQESKQDQDYLQLVSMFKQKNEKLHNPLKSF